MSCSWWDMSRPTGEPRCCFFGAPKQLWHQNSTESQSLPNWLVFSIGSRKSQFFLKLFNFFSYDSARFSWEKIIIIIIVFVFVVVVIIVFIIIITYVLLLLLKRKFNKTYQPTNQWETNIFIDKFSSIIPSKLINDDLLGPAKVQHRLRRDFSGRTVSHLDPAMFV